MQRKNCIETIIIQTLGQLKMCDDNYFWAATVRLFLEHEPVSLL